MKETLTEKILNNVQYIDLQITMNKGKVLKPEVNSKISTLIQDCKELLNRQEKENNNEVKKKN